MKKRAEDLAGLALLDFGAEMSEAPARSSGARDSRQSRLSRPPESATPIVLNAPVFSK